MADAWGGTVSSLDFYERWIRDGLRVVESIGGMCSVMIDMTECSSIMKRLKSEGQSVKYAAVIVCAVAKAISRHPELQKLVAGNKKLLGGDIDICLSIAGDDNLTPVVIIGQADGKSAPQIESELSAKAPIARAEADRVMKVLRQFGWLLPFGFLRRRLIKSLLGRLWYRKKVSGTFQITILPGLDFVAAQVFNTAAALAVGGVSERPLVVEGDVKVRLTAPFTCSIDHKQWHGMNAAVLLTELRKIFEREAESLF